MKPGALSSSTWRIPLIQRTIEAPLRVEPDVETRNRKPLKRSVGFVSTRKMLFGPNNRFRDFCEVERGRREVYVLAIGVKQRNRLRIGREEIEL